MGLDMYAYTAPRELIDRETDIVLKDVWGVFPGFSELHYWRKHPNLHGWMEALYRQKGGTDPDFNGATLRLTLADLAALEKAVCENTLPETSGCFFGVSDGSERLDDLEFIGKARLAIGEGLAVIYDSSW